MAFKVPLRFSTFHFSRGLAVVAVLVAAASASQFTFKFNNAAHENAFRLMLICFGVVWTALWLGQTRMPVDAAVPDTSVVSEALVVPQRRTWGILKRGALVLGLAMLVILSEINGQFLKWDALLHVSHHIQFILWCAGIGLFTWGMIAPVSDHAQPTRAETLERAFLIVLTLFALMLRLWNVGDGMRVFVDETHFADPVRHFWTQHDIKLLQPFSSIAAFPYLYPYFQAVTVDLFGRTLAGLRIPSAVFGALTVPALYLLAKQLFDRQTAIIAALILLTFPPHLQFSRIGLNNIADPLFGVLAFGLLVRAVRDGRQRDFVLAGAAMGLTQYFYEGGRFMFPALAAIWLAWLLFTRWKKLPFSSRRGLVAFMVMALVVSTPIYYTLAGMGRPVAQRIATASMPTRFWEEGLNNPSELVERFLLRVQENALLLTTHAEGEYYYQGDVPLLMPLMIIPFILGLGIMLWRWRTAGGSLLVLWLAAPLLALSLLMSHLANAARFVVIYPVLALVMAVGIRQTATLILNGLPRLEIRVLWAIAFACCAMQGVYYFGTHIPLFLEIHYIQEPGQEAAFQAAKLPPNTFVHIIDEKPFSAFVARSIVEFLTDGVHVAVYTPDTLTDAVLEAQPREVNQAFYVRWLDENSKAQLARHFPIDLDHPLAEGNQWTITNPYVLYFVPASPAIDTGASVENSG